MSKLVVISISKAPAKMKGKLQRLMLEVKPGVFVWKLSAKKVRVLWNEIITYKCNAFCIFSAKN